MTLLTIVNAAQSRLNLPISSTVVGNTSQTQKQLLAIANAEGIDTADAFAWQNLITEATFTTTATETQTNATFASDFGWIVQDTFWDRTATLPVRGPLSPSEWQAIKAQSSPVAEPRFRIRGNTILFNPAPAAGHTCAYEYVSKNWCRSSGGTDQSLWAADTDVPKLPENVMVLGIIWRWKEAKELDYAEAYNTWFEARARAAARDGAKKKMSIVGPVGRVRGRGTIPEGNWS